MNRNAYLAGIIWLSIIAIFSCFWIANSLIHGTDFNEFVSFPKLVVIDGISVLLCEIILLIYFHAKKYKITFAFSLLSTITFLVLFTTVYLFYNGIGTGVFINLIVTIHLLAVTMFSLTLMSSKASDRPLLKTAGNLGAIAGFIILLTHVVGVYMPEGATLDLIININMWVGRLGGLIVIFYILNFYQEMKQKQTFGV
ncbi:hypothetical protein [Ekhidna sp.]|uniref:hypothetical protein n=1 Tax=Ekhidna sp. TaxID=2608089 RepID=UPI0032992A34